MLVQEIMITNIRSATAESNIQEIAMTMCFNKISGMPVIDAERNIIGVISEKDILRGMYPKVDEFMGSGMNAGRTDFEKLESEYSDMMNMKVKDIMTPNVFTVKPDEPILRAVSIMCLRKIRRIPVAIDGKLVGIVSMGDVHKAIFQNNINLSQSEKLVATA
jgi:CBS domain-containing protein